MAKFECFYRINGTFDHGQLTGFAEVYYINGDLLRAAFGAGSTLHGLAARFDTRSRLLWAARYEGGVRIGPGWQMSPEFGAGFFGVALKGDKGKVNDDGKGKSLLCYFSNSSDAFALTGKFQDSILQGEAVAKRLSRVGIATVDVAASVATEPFLFIGLVRRGRIHATPGSSRSAASHLPQRL